MSSTSHLASAGELSAVAAEWVNRRAAGLSSTEDAELAAWLAIDSRHRDAFERSCRVWSLMDRPHETGVAEQMINQLGERRQMRARRRAVIAGVGAVTAIVLLMGAYLPFRDAPALSQSAVLAEVRRQILPDGTVVEFRADAQVEARYVPDARRVRLVQGEAHFQVKADAARPFIVLANGVEVRAIGTAFAVRLGPQAIEILVTEGRVSVDRDGAIKPPAASIGAGSRAMVSTVESSTQVQVSNVTPAERERSLAWRYPRLEFSGTPLAEAIELFNRHASGPRPIRLRVEDASLRNLEVSGYFRTDNVEGFVRLLEDSFGVKAEPASDREIVLRRAR